MLLLAACSSSDDAGSDIIVPENKATDEEAIALDVYTTNYTTTRAAGINDLNDLCGKGTGFGVFCFNTESTVYTTGQTSASPNLMYNQLVTGEKTGNTYTWSYTPLKYWPNATIDINGTTYPNISFFAYAPHSSNATSITPSANDYKGDPTITYTSETDAESTDILVAKANMNMKHDYPADNPTQQTIGSKVTFEFSHALAKIGGKYESGGLAVKLDIDNSGNVSGGSKPADTKVTISSIEISQVGYRTEGSEDTKKDVYTSGTLNLATGKWGNFTTSESERSPYTITTSGSGNTIKGSLAEPASVTSFDNDLPDGVTTDEQNIFDNEASPLLIIPDGKRKPVLRFKITYTVRTKDGNMAKGYTEIPQTITRDVILGTAAEQGHRYNITMHLGLTSVKFTGSNVAWDFNSEVHYDDKSKNPNTTDEYLLYVEEGQPTSDDEPYLSKKNNMRQ